jgi:hypothetical protein
MRSSAYAYYLLLLVASLKLCAQTPPCGVAIVKTHGPDSDERFVAATPAQVESAVLKALPAIAMKVHKQEGLHIEAETDEELWRSLWNTNKEAGVKGKEAHLGAFGKTTVDIRESTQDGVQGSLLHIEFHKNAMKGRMGSAGYPQPLAEGYYKLNPNRLGYY